MKTSGLRYNLALCITRYEDDDDVKTGVLRRDIRRKYRTRVPPQPKANFFDVILSTLIGTLFCEDGRARKAGSNGNTKLRMGNESRDCSYFFHFVQLFEWIGKNHECPRSHSKDCEKEKGHCLLVIVASTVIIRTTQFCHKKVHKDGSLIFFKG